MHQGLSIVIATRNRPQLLERALGEAARFARATDEIIVVDSASAPGIVERIVESHPGVRLARLEVPGTSRARNAGLELATRDLVAFIDDDCLIQSGWPDAVEGSLSDDGVGFATGRVVGDRDTSLGISLLLGEERLRFDAPEDPGMYGHGSNMAFSRRALETVGGFDEALGPGTPLRAAEDQDVFWRISRAGWAGVFEPTMTVTHLQWRSRGTAILRHYSYGIGAGAVAVKLIRSRDPLRWRVLRRLVWRDGILRALRAAIKRHKSPAAAEAVKLAGLVVGFVRAWLSPFHSDRFDVRRSRS